MKHIEKMNKINSDIAYLIELLRNKGITLKVIPMNEKGELNLDEYRKLFSDKTRLVSVTHVSNVLGTVNPVKAMIEIAHEQDVPVLIDGACAGSSNGSGPKP